MERLEYLVPRSGHVFGAPHLMSGLDKVSTRIEAVSYNFAVTLPAASVLFFAIFAVRLGLARLRQGLRVNQVEVVSEPLECAHC
jgi:hypothetical protein